MASNEGNVNVDTKATETGDSIPKVKSEKELKKEALKAAKLEKFKAKQAAKDAAAKELEEVNQCYCRLKNKKRFRIT